MYPEKKPELYGGDAFLLGKSPGEAQFQQALGTLGAPTMAPGEKGQQGAEGQLWQGIEQQQQLGQSTASRRGFNPLAARAATASGAEMESQGFGMAQQLRAAEEAQRRAGILGAYQSRSAYDQAMGQLAQQQFGSALERKLYEDAMQRGIYETQRAKEQAEKEGYMGALSGGLQMVGDIVQGAIGSDPNMKTNIGAASNDVDRAIALFNPLGSKPSQGVAGMAGKMAPQAGSLIKSLMGGGKVAQVPGAGDVPIGDMELFKWSAQQSGQSLPAGMLGGQGGVTGLVGALLSDEQMKQGIAPAGEVVDEAIAMPGDEGYQGIEQLYGILGEQPEQVVNGARMVQTGEYGNAANPRAVTMYLGNKGNAQVMRQGGDVDQNAEPSPWQQLVASGRKGAQPMVAVAPARDMSGIDYAGRGIAMQDIGEGGPANTITRVEATPAKASAQARKQADENAPKLLAALQEMEKPQASRASAKAADREIVFAPEQIVGKVPGLDMSYEQMQASPFYRGESITDQLMRQQAAKRQQAMAEQMNSKATRALEAAKAAPSASKVDQEAMDEFMRTAEQSINATGQVDVDAILRKNLPDYKKPEEVDAFLDGIRPLSYNYKPAAAARANALGIATPGGRQLGITTADMKRSNLGSQAVIPTPAGEAVGIPQAVNLSLAGLARMNKRLRDLEGK